MALTEEQQALVTEFGNRLLSDALGAPDSSAAQLLTEWMVATEARRLTMLKDWASQQIVDEDEVVEDQQTRLIRMEGERDVRRPVLDSIASLTRL